LPAAFATAPVPQSIPSLRLPSPLVEPDVRISRIRLSDWFHVTAHAGAGPCRGPSRAIPNGPKIVRPENRCIPWPISLCRRRRKCRTLLESGSLTWEQSVIRKMRKSRDFDPQDQEHLVETGSVTDFGTNEKEGEKVRWHTMNGVTVEGMPAKFTVEVRGHRGTVTEAEWLP